MMKSAIRFFFLMVVALSVSASFAASDAPVEYELRDIDGKKHSLAGYRGKWVIVNYWATWCPPCVEEIPELVMFHEAHKDKDAVVLGIASEDISMAKLRGFLDEFFVNYPMFKTLPGSATPFGRIRALPTTFVITPQGEVAARTEGGITRESIENFMVKWDAYQAKKAKRAKAAQ